MNESRKPVIAALTANSAIAATKLAAAFISGSTAMLAEGIHSLADTGNQLLLLLGMHRSEKPADDDHPFGHGKERFFWTFVVALMLFSVGGLFSIYRGVSGLVHGEKTPELWLNLVVLLLAAVFEGSALRVALRAFNRARRGRSFYAGIRGAKDPETLTVVFEDTAALSGIVVAIAGVVLAHVTHNGRFDAGAAVGIGLILLVMAAGLARESRDLLLGESATPEVRRRIRETIEEVEQVDRICELLTMHVGPDDVLVNVEINFANGLDTDGVEDAINAVEARVKEAVPEAARIFVEPRRSADARDGAPSA